MKARLLAIWRKLKHQSGHYALLYRGTIPMVLPDNQAFNKRYAVADSGVGLATRLRDRPQSVLVVFCGDCEPTVLRDAKGASIGGDWWSVGASAVWMAFYGCHTASYLANAVPREYFSGGVGFDGLLWAPLDSSSVARAAWCDVMTDLETTLLDAGRVDRATVARLRSTIDSRIISAANSIGYDMLICLTQHAERLKYVDGGKI